MNEIVAIFAGLGLAAACGFRVFVPLFIASLAANSGFEADLAGLGFNVQEIIGGAASDDSSDDSSDGSSDGSSAGSSGSYSDSDDDTAASSDSDASSDDAIMGGRARARGGAAATTPNANIIPT